MRRQKFESDANRSLMRQRRLEPDADRCCGGDMRHSGGFLLRIMPPSWHPVPACVRSGCCRRNHSPLPQGKLVLDAENRCRYDRSRRNLSSLPLRRLESDAYRCCGRNRCHSGCFLLRIMPPSWHPVPACVRDGCCRRNHSPPLHRFPSLGLKSRIDARISRSSARILSTSPPQHAFITR